MLFKEFLIPHPDLAVVNSLEICEGKIMKKKILNFHLKVGH